MSLTEEQRKEIRNMVETHPGWKHVEKWLEGQLSNKIDILVDHEDPIVRGEIKAIKRLKKKIESSLKNYEEKDKEED